MAKSYIKHDEYSKLPFSAIQANSLGIPYYYTGKECKKGHLSPKYTSSGNCVACIEEKRNVTFQRFKGRSTKRSIENQIEAENAFLNGFTTYKSKSPCKLGHFERYVGTNNCVDCNAISMKKRKESARWSRFKKQYGVSKDHFLSMLEKQSHKCCICKINLTDKNTHIDHCHKSKKVRGLLCNKCNQAIGLFDENEEKLNSAINYLRDHSETS